jgi:hypothetical protein
MKPLLVGPAPGKRAPASWPAFGPGPGSGQFLCRLLGIGAVRHEFDAVNLLDRWPGRAANGGDLFPIGEAREAALSIGRRGVIDDRPFVLLAGHNVAGAFGVRVPYLTWERFDCGVPVAVIPHPSGLNRWWNKPANRERARRFITEGLGQLREEGRYAQRVLAEDAGRIVVL